MLKNNSRLLQAEKQMRVQIVRQEDTWMVWLVHISWSIDMRSARSIHTIISMTTPIKLHLGVPYS